MFYSKPDKNNFFEPITWRFIRLSAYVESHDSLNHLRTLQTSLEKSLSIYYGRFIKSSTYII